MSWSAYYGRKAALHKLLALADRQEAATLDELLEAVPKAREAFVDPQSVLYDTQMMFLWRVHGAVDLLLSDGRAESAEAAVITAWAEVAEAMPGARSLLDAAECDGLLVKAFAKERVTLASLAGHAGPIGDAQTYGAQLRGAAIERITAAEPIDDAPSASIFGRLRGVLAA